MNKKIKTLIRLSDLYYHKTTYAVVDLTEDELAFFSQCHDLISGVHRDMTDEQTDATNTISAAIDSMFMDDDHSENEKKYIGAWKGMIVSKEEARNVSSVDQIIVASYNHHYD